MPEAYSESMEILREIERIRPEWLRETPDFHFFNRLKKDWTRKMGGFWVRCARSPNSEARFITGREGDLIEDARVQTKNARKEMIEGDWKRNAAMDKTLASLTQPVTKARKSLRVMRKRLEPLTRPPKSNTCTWCASAWSAKGGRGCKSLGPFDSKIGG